MFEKVQTKAGPGQSQIYAALERGVGALPSWNFGKYLVSRSGNVLKSWLVDAARNVQTAILVRDLYAKGILHDVLMFAAAASRRARPAIMRSCGPATTNDSRGRGLIAVALRS
jgi:hypothetical protein